MMQEVKLILSFLPHLLPVAHCRLKFPRFGFRTAVRDTKSSRLRAASPRALPCPGCLRRCQRTSTIHRSAAWTSRIYWPCTDTWTVSVPSARHSPFTKKVIDYNFVHYSISMQNFNILWDLKLYRVYRCGRHRHFMTVNLIYRLGSEIVILEKMVLHFFFL